MLLPFPFVEIRVIRLIPKLGCLVPSFQVSNMPMAKNVTGPHGNFLKTNRAWALGR